MDENTLPDDASLQNPDEETAGVYPVGEAQRIGVSTDLGTPPASTDQGDEEVEREQYGLPE
jgi:hypothetical protein